MKNLYYSEAASLYNEVNFVVCPVLEFVLFINEPLFATHELRFTVREKKFAVQSHLIEKMHTANFTSLFSELASLQFDQGLTRPLQLLTASE